MMNRGDFDIGCGARREGAQAAEKEDPAIAGTGSRDSDGKVMVALAKIV